MASEIAASGVCKLPALALETEQESNNHKGQDAKNAYRSELLQPLLELMGKVALEEPLMAQSATELAGFLVRWLISEQLKPPLQVVQPFLAWLEATPEEKALVAQAGAAGAAAPMLRHHLESSWSSATACTA